MTAMKYLNLAAYKFISLTPEQLILLRDNLKKVSLANEIKGTILLSLEGINLFIAGKGEAIPPLTDYLKTVPAFADLIYKQSESDFIPFKRMRVRIKKEIICMNQPRIQPEKE